MDIITHWVVVLDPLLLREKTSKVQWLSSTFFMKNIFQVQTCLCLENLLTISWLCYPHFTFLEHSRARTINGSLNLLVTPNFPTGELSFALLHMEENQDHVPSWSLVHSRVDSNSSHNPKTFQTWFFLE